MAPAVVDVLIVRDGDGNDVGAVTEYERLVTRDALNQPGGWSLLVDADHPAVTALRAEGAGIAVLDPSGDVTFSGPASPSVAGTAASRETTATSDTVLFSGPSDLGALWWRRCVPPTGESHLTESGPFGVAAARIVDSQLGPAALTDRRLGPWRPIENDIGNTVTLSGRYEPVGDLLATEADQQELVLSARWSPAGVVTFHVTQRNPVGFPLSISADGTVSRQRIDNEPATATYVYGLGQGEGADRVTAEAGTATGWGRIEAVLDRRDLSTFDGVEQATGDAVQTGRQSISVLLSDDYGLNVGDTARLDVWGTETSLVVAEVRTETTPRRTVRTVAVGSPPSVALSRIIEAARRTIIPQT